MECKDFEPSIIQDDKILKVAKRLKTFTIEDIVMFCEIDTETAGTFLQKSENIKVIGNKFEYVETTRVEDKFRIADKNVLSINSNISVVTACKIFLENCQNRNLTYNSLKAYKTFTNAHIIPFFKNFKLKDITISDVEDFRKTMKNIPISERRIKNILALLNQMIRYFQNEGYIDKTCVFKVKRVANIPKRQIQILTTEQQAQLLKIIKKKYSYMLPIVQKLFTLKQPLNNILTGSDQEIKSQKEKIRKDFYKVKQELGLTNYIFDDLSLCNLDN